MRRDFAEISSVVQFVGDRLYKTVRPMLSDRCPVLSVTLVYCGQTFGWIKMKPGMQVDLGPGHTVLDGTSSPHEKGHSSPSLLKFRNDKPRPMSILAKRLDGGCHLVRRLALAQATLC